MKRLWQAIRYSSVGMFFAGIVMVLQGCTEREGSLALILILLLQFCSGPGDVIDESGPQLGQIADTILNSFRYDTDDNTGLPDIIEVGPGVFAIAYAGAGNDGFVTTLSIDANGNVGPNIETFEFDIVNGQNPDIIQVGPGVYAIAYTSDSTDGFVVTLSIDATGDIGAAVIESFGFDTSLALNSSIIQVGPGVYAIAYTGQDNDGFVVTLSIDAAGDIGAAVIESFEFDGVFTDNPDIIQVGTGIYAIVYTGQDMDGFVVTLSIDAAGDIGAAVIESFEYDTIQAITPVIIQVGTGVYAIVHSDSDQDGILTTLPIDSAGDIGAVIEAFEYETTRGVRPDIVNVSGTVYAIAFESLINSGEVVTIDISATGDITAAIIDTLEIAPFSQGRVPRIINVTGDIYAVTRTSTTVDSGRLVTTIQIN